MAERKVIIGRCATTTLPKICDICGIYGFLSRHRVGLAEVMTFYMPLTQELIGDALGLTTVHVNRTFRSLRDDKLIEINGKSITILDFEALSLLTDFENSYLGETARAIREPISPQDRRLLGSSHCTNNWNSPSAR